MRKNFQIHLLIESELADSLKREAEEHGVMFSEYCRRKLRENSRLEVIEKMLIEVLNKHGSK